MHDSRHPVLPVVGLSAEEAQCRTPGLITVREAAEALGLSLRPTRRLVDVGALVDGFMPLDRGVDLPLTSGLTLVPEKDVADLAEYERLDEDDLADRGETVIALHSNGIRFDQRDAHRTASGVDLLNRHGLSPAERFTAWAGYWPITEWMSNRLRGCIAMADTSGFLWPKHFAVRIEAFDRVETDFGIRTRFWGRPLTADEQALFLHRRFRVAQGNIWQILGRPLTD